ncbi:MAG: helix-turn-helix domain-containing protein [Candidatus Micrarchaeota archaeon]|nr:helix-turn-helix domain-containing protein [Candidatus Micrarchaeota archaeon]MDE1847583.1 helix-turn-helix domain-containing protein [Candidatus Micrarchaeota archaeon]MDE1864815.1 helix-turn-helix domain-containing protein [Candidatus Micrarchaeota archaeon]
MNDVGPIRIAVRKLMVSARKKGKKIKSIAKMFGVSRKTVWKWWRRTRKRGGISYKNLSTRPKTVYRKIDRKLEEQIIAIRKLTNWRTERIWKVLISVPKISSGTCQKGYLQAINIRISRQSINCARVL